MNLLKIKIADEPRILVSTVTHPFQVILKMNGSDQSLSGIIKDEDFLYSNDNNIEFNKAICLLVENKINFHVEF